MANKLNDFYSLYNPTFKYLQSIKCERTISEKNYHTDGTYEIDLVLSKYDNITPKSIIMHFRGATNIKIGDLGGLLCMLIDIDDISSNGLENIKFMVCETEYNTFSFMCNDFSIDLIPWMN